MKRVKVRLLSVVLMVAMLISMVPVHVFAAQTGYSAAAAIPITLGKTYTKVWNKNNDSKPHYVKFTLPTAGYITISYERPTDSEGETMDLEHVVSDANGRTCVEYNTSEHSPITERLETFVALSAGTYYLNTTLYGAWITSGNFAIDYKVMFTPGDNYEIEPNAGIATATLAELNKTYFGFTHASGVGEDYWKFYVPQDCTVRVYLPDYVELKNSSVRSCYFFGMSSQGTAQNYLSAKYDTNGEAYIKLNCTAGYNYFNLKSFYRQMMYEVRFVIEHDCAAYYKETVLQEPTCSAVGYKANICSLCGAKDTASVKTIPTTPHTTVVLNAKEATCQAEGYTGDKKCTVCQQIVESGTAISKVAHAYKEVVLVEPTCEAKGYKGNVCSTCGEKDTASVRPIPATGHSYEEVVLVEPTYESNGYKGNVCSTCGKKDTASVRPIPALALAFTDVPANVWYTEPVAWAVSKGITNGTSATTFSPNDTCTRAQIITFLWRAVGSPKATAANPFTDVKKTDYFYDAAIWAYGKGMVSGTAFAPKTPCTREATVVYLWKNAGSPTVKVDSTFTDVPATADYAQAVAWAVSNGITNGTSATTFSPATTCTRGQIVTFLYRAIK